MTESIIILTYEGFYKKLITEKILIVCKEGNAYE